MYDPTRDVTWVAQRACPGRAVGRALVLARTQPMACVCGCARPRGLSDSPLTLGRARRGERGGRRRERCWRLPG
jgi:hypothetical protein